MQPLLDIRFKDGRQRIVDLQTYVSGDPFGRNVASELEIRWDDVSEGLFLEISVNEPRGAERPAAGRVPEGPDERGDACELSAAAYYCILDGPELAQVSRVSYNGEAMMRSLEGELVVLAKLNELCADYLGDPSALLVAIAELYPLLRWRFARELPGDGEGLDVDRAVAAEMGISEGLLYKALEAAAVAAEQQALDALEDGSAEGEGPEGPAG